MFQYVEDSDCRRALLVFRRGIGVSLRGPILKVRCEAATMRGRAPWKGDDGCDVAPGAGDEIEGGMVPRAIAAHEYGFRQGGGGGGVASKRGKPNDTTSGQRATGELHWL